jgi:hypothetical protein
MDSELIEKVSKKDQIASLYSLGITSVEELSVLTQSRPSYVAGVLRDAQLLSGYFDLYTTTDRPMNVYSKLFAKRLGFKNTASSRRSIDFINQLYQQFGRIGDRAGQHHALLMALTMYNRARWSGKTASADIFRQWLMTQLAAEESVPVPQSQLR